MWAIRRCPSSTRWSTAETRAELVVVDDDVDAVEVDVTFTHDDGGRVGDGLGQGVARRGDSQQHQPVDAQFEEGLDGLVLERGVPAAGADEQPQALTVEALLKAVEELGVEGVVQVGDEGADQMGAAFDEAAGDGVGPVSQLPGRLQNRLPAMLAHVR